MNCQYICPKHAAEVQDDEKIAKELWQEFMNRGVHDYALCRWDKAQTFLASAFEIAAIRSASQSNAYFSGANLLRPFKFMFEMLISDNDYSDATNHLIRAFSLIGSHNPQAIRTEVFILQRYSLKLKRRIENSQMQEEKKQSLISICNKICFYEKENSFH